MRNHFIFPLVFSTPAGLIGGHSPEEYRLKKIRKSNIFTPNPYHVALCGRPDTEIKEIPIMMKTSRLRYGIQVRLEIVNKPGMLGRVASAIGKAGGDIGSIDIVGFRGDAIVRDVTVTAGDHDMEQRIIANIGRIHGIRILDVADRTFMAHQGGKIEIRSKLPLKTRADLSMAYTPGVARVSMAIHENPERAHELTIKKNTVAIVSDGTAVLGLGDIGPRAAMPVMEGKAMLFKAFGGVDAFPICLDTKDPEEIIKVVKWISLAFSASGCDTPRKTSAPLMTFVSGPLSLPGLVIPAISFLTGFMFSLRPS
jgi:hypothetical protein